MPSRLLFIAAALQLAGCASFLNRNAPRQRTLEELLGAEYIGAERVVTSTLRAGPFFGDTKLHLADNRPQAIIDLYNHAGRLLATPDLSVEQVSVGTEVRIRDIVMPSDPTAELTTASVDETPSAHPWVVLEVTSVIGRGKRYVVALPREATSPLAFTAALGRYVSKPCLFEERFAHQSRQLKDTIEKKEVAPGMSSAEMLAALGTPRNYEEHDGGALTPFVADYGPIKVHLEGPTVTAVEGLEQKTVSMSGDVADALAAIASVSAVPDDDVASDAGSVAEEPASKRKKASKAHKAKKRGGKKKRGRGRH